MSNYKASVIVPTYNRAELLGKTLESIRIGHTNYSDFEVVVVDDGSSDNSFQVVKSFETTMDIKYVYQPDLGFRAARARNLAMKIAEGDILVFLDCGILACKDMINVHIASHLGHEKRYTIGYIFGFSNDDEDSQELLDLYKNHTNLDTLLLELDRERKFLDIRERCYARCGDLMQSLPAPWAISWAGNVSFRREAFLDGVCFDEWFSSWGAEDLDFGLSMFHHGYQFFLERKANSFHHPHPKSLADNTGSSRKNKAYLHEKYKMPETEILLTTQSVELNLKLAK